jgi:hypothetical protein
MISRLHQHQSSDDPLAILGLSSNALNQTALEVLHDHIWIVEEELRMCIGLPPWFDGALRFVLAEIACGFAEYKPENNCVAHWTRRKARRICEELESTLTEHHATNGIVRFSGCETLEAVVGSILQRKRSFYWEELRLSKSLSSLEVLIKCLYPLSPKT